MKKGNLLNLTDGGEGAIGAVKSEEEKQKMREFHLGVKKSPKAVAKSASTRAKKRSKIKNFICTKTLKTWGTIGKCAEDNEITFHTLSSYLNPNKLERNTTTIMRYEEYLKFGIIPPLPKKNQREKVINVKTEEVYPSMNSGSKVIGMCKKKFYDMMKGKQKNTTDFILLSEYNNLLKK